MRWIKSSNETSAQLLGLSPLRNDVESLSIKTNLATDSEKDFQSRAQTPQNQSTRKSRIGKFKELRACQWKWNFDVVEVELVMQI